MTCEELKSLIAENGGPNCLCGLVFDNSGIIRFSEKNPFEMEQLVTIGGVEYLVRKSVFTRRSTKKLDVKIKTYYELSCLQSALFYEDAKDQYDIDYTMFGELK